MDRKIIFAVLLMLFMTGVTEAQLYTQAWGPDFGNGVLYLGRSGYPTTEPDDLLIVGNRPSHSMQFRTNNTEKVRIDGNGRVAVGISPNGLNRLFNLYGTNPSIMLEGTGTTTTQKIEFGNSSTATQEIAQYVYPSCGSNRLRIGPVAASSKAIHILATGGSPNKIVFSDNYLFGWGTCITTFMPGLSGTYLFDDQVSSTSLLVSPPATSSSYPVIPTGYIFNVQGKSAFNGLVQINDVDTDPVNTVSGLTVGNNSNSTVGSTTNVAPFSWIQTENGRPLVLNPIVNNNPTTTNTSYVAIGFIPGTPGNGITVPLNYKLAVKGKIICEELKVKYAGTWSDYVFKKDYKLRDLKEVESFIAEHNHLPDVPSEQEVKENGFESGEMDATLLRKIEELTLYMIKMQKEQNETNARLLELEKENDLLKQLIKK